MGVGVNFYSWWRHQMERFSALLAICVGNSPVPGEFPAQRPVTRCFDVLFDLRLNKRLSKHSWGWWFETLSRPLWRHCNVVSDLQVSCSDLKRAIVQQNGGCRNGHQVTFCRRHFQMYFLQWKCMIFRYKFHWTFYSILFYSILFYSILRLQLIISQHCFK